jgi:hypothetical protein
MSDDISCLVELVLNSPVPFLQMLGHNVENGAITMESVKVIDKLVKREKGSHDSMSPWPY